jgi:hypothetical protein
VDNHLWLEIEWGKPPSHDSLHSHLIGLIRVESPKNSEQWSRHGECVVLKVSNFSHHLKLELCNVILPKDLPHNL